MMDSAQGVLTGSGWEGKGAGVSACPWGACSWLAGEGQEEQGHTTVHNKALSPVEKTFLLACACTDVAIFRAGE